MDPADSHSVISLTTQYLFIRIFVIFFGKKELKSLQTTFNKLEQCQGDLLQVCVTHILLINSDV